MLLELLLLSASTLSTRQEINLDAGWQFVRVPNPPSIWAGPDAVPTATWRILNVSSQETASEDGKAANALDGNPKTIWHTEWSKQQPGYPHEIAIDLGSRVEAAGLRILPRQTSPYNGRPNHFDLYLSNSPTAWGSPVLTDTVPDSSNLYTHKFPPTTCHFMRLVFKDGHKPEPYLALSEIGLIKNLGPKDQKSWDSQYNIATVQTSGDRFDPTPAQIEEAKTQELKLIQARHWENATLPHAAWPRPLGTSEIWQGVAYYRRPLTRPSHSQGKKVQFTLSGAMQSSDLWLNGKHIASRRGGYLPMVVDLTKELKDRNDLLVRVDNRDNPLIPPGKPQAELDFMYGNGLYRHASLTLTNQLHITDPLAENVQAGGGIYVTYPQVTDKQAILDIRTHIRNEGVAPATFQLTQAVESQNQKTTKTETYTLQPRQAHQFQTSLTLQNPHLWSPDAPNLYRLTTTLTRQGKIEDQTQTQIGIRKIEVSRKKGFVLNGHPIRLVGTNRHQDYPWVGPALSDAANARDAVLIRQAGHNIVRLSHYPQSPAFLDACDRLGLMVIPCTAGWQFLNNDPRFVARVDRDIRQLIRRDRNHPSAVFWEASLNETYPPAATAKQWSASAKAEAQDDNILTAGDAAHGAKWDVAYNQWKDEDMSRPQNDAPDRPGYIREYGDYEFGGDLSTSRVKIGQGMDKLLQEAWNHVWSLNKLRPQYPWTMGVGTWEMFDTNVPWNFKVSACGLADFFRRPKPSYWFFASQEAKKPMLKIAATWQPGAPTRTIVVFTNCDYAVLKVNGKQIEGAYPEFTPETLYNKAEPFDGTNTGHLTHPPLVFWNVPFTPGTLTVEGFAKDKKAVEDIVKTAAKPVKIKVWVDDLGVPQQPNDLLFVRAALVDAKGNICPDQDRKIKFQITGAATFAGEDEAPSEMGIASVLIRTPMVLGRYKITAHTADGLTN